MPAVLDDLGHSFFSLNVGMGPLLTYASYISKKENLTTTTVLISATDTIIALPAALTSVVSTFEIIIEYLTEE